MNQPQNNGSRGKDRTSGRGSVEKTENDKKVVQPLRNKVRKLPMVRYESATSTLRLNRSAIVDGEPMLSNPVDLDFKEIPEEVRQALVALAKLVIAYANGHDVTAKVKTKDSTTATLPASDLLIAKLDKLRKRSKVIITKPVEAVVSSSEDTVG